LDRGSNFAALKRKAPPSERGLSRISGLPSGKKGRTFGLSSIADADALPMPAIVIGDLAALDVAALIVDGTIIIVIAVVVGGAGKEAAEEAEAGTSGEGAVAAIVGFSGAGGRNCRTSEGGGNQSSGEDLLEHDRFPCASTCAVLRLIDGKIMLAGWKTRRAIYHGCEYRPQLKKNAACHARRYPGAMIGQEA
jgi:hypothetical protein